MDSPKEEVMENIYVTCKYCKAENEIDKNEYENEGYICAKCFRKNHINKNQVYYDNLPEKEKLKEDFNILRYWYYGVLFLVFIWYLIF